MSSLSDWLADVSPEVHCVLESVRLAPSGHNVQPWLLRVADTRTLEVDWRRDRHLDVVDPDGFGVCYCLGCAVEAATRVADVRFDPGDDGNPLDPHWRAGTLHIAGPRSAGSIHALELLRERWSDRRPYRVERPAPATMRELVAAGSKSGTRVLVVNDRRGIAALASLSAEGARRSFRDPHYIEELISWTRLNDDETRLRPDGFTAATLRLDPVARSAFRILRASGCVRQIAARRGFGKLVARATAANVERSGALLLIAGEGSNPHQRLTSGRAMLSVWLAATSIGLSVQPVSDALGAQDLRTEVLKVFGARADEDPAVVLRVGWPSSVDSARPRAPRLCLEDLVAKPVD